MVSNSYRGALLLNHLPSSSFSFSFLCIFPAIAFGSVIYPNTSLSPSSSASNYWTSSNGTFSLGFFSFSPNSYYVGIWYSSLPINQSVIWTANRNQNVTLNSSLHFTPNGQLQLIASNSSVIWSASDLTSNDVVNHASQAELLDTGNFVLRDNTSNVIWQSFDHPTDTLLPDQNFTFSDNPSLVPWISTTDPSPSTTYSFVFGETGGPKGKIRLLYQNSEYWTEPYTYDKALVSPTFRLDSNGTASLQDSDGELIWWSTNTVNQYVSCSIAPNSITKVQLGVDGNLRVLTWSNASNKWDTEWRALYLQCDVFGACGDNAICDRTQNNLTAGAIACPAVEPTMDTICSCPSGFTTVDGNCNPQSAINCSQYMITMDHTEFGVPATVSNYQNLSQQACISHCLDDCSCTVATYENSTSDCWVQQGSLFNGVTYSQYMKTSFIKTIASNSSAANTSSSTSFPVYAIILIVTGFLIVALFFAGFLIRSQYSSRFPNFKEVVLPDMTDRLGGPRRFTFEDLYMVTRGFHEENKLGSGGFGSVYRGTFTAPTRPHGTLDVAIKRLYQRHSSDKALDEEDSDFMVEIETLASIRHVNVVNLMGFCAQGPERLLVYEFVANGSLNNHLFSESNLLDWDTRFWITVGAATGIEYLHTHCPKKIVHRDIKPANILIDEEFRAKVADFGISEIMGPEREHLTNYNPRGTPTYMAPECWQVGALVTEKADAYSFGVLVLEIVSGKRVKKQQYKELDDDGGGGDQGIRRRGVLYFQHALGFMEVKNYEGLVDERLEGVYDKEDAERLVKVAFWCLQGHPDQRPSMEDLLLMIKGHKQVDPPPLPGLYEFHLSSCSNSSSLTIINIPEQVSAGR